MMKISKTDFDGLVIIEPMILTDINNEAIIETFNEDFFIKYVNQTKFIQENESMSTYGVLRGLHYQLPPYSQSKLVKVSIGSILDVAVDLRKDSKTFGKYFALEISDKNYKQIFIPKGFAHGFVSLTDTVVLQYKCDNYYNKNSEIGIAWNDPDLQIDWGIKNENIILSEKDSKNSFLKDILNRI